MNVFPEVNVTLCDIVCFTDVFLWLKKHIYSLYFVIKLTEFESWYFFLIKSNKAQNLLWLLDGRHATNNEWN